MSDSGSTLKPSHESIVDTINLASNPAFLAEFGEHIKRTEIPKGHDAIIEAWKANSADLGLNDDRGVVESIMAQKPAEEVAMA